MPDLVFANRGAAEAIRTQQQINAGARQLQDEYKQSAREAASLERAAKRVYDQLRTPQEQLLKKMGEIKKAQREGLIPPKDAETALGRLDEKMKGLETQSNKTFGEGAISRLGTFTAGLAPVSAAIATLTAEFKSQLELIDKAAQTQLSLVPSRQGLIDNLTGLDAKTIREVVNKSTQISLSRGVPEAFINPAIGSGVSASSGNVAATIAATDFAAQRFADRPALIEGAVGSLLDISAVTGTNDPRVNAGVIGLIAQQSRLTSADKISATAPKALVSLAGRGASLPFSTAIFTTLSNAIKDKDGDITKSASIALGKAIGELQGGDDFNSLPTLDAKILAIQNDPELRKLLFSKPIGGPAESIIPVRDLLTPGTAVARNFAANRAGVSGFVGLRSLADQGVSNLALDPLFPVATAKRQIAALNENLRKRATRNLDQGTREELLEIRQRLGSTNLSARLNAFFEQFQDGNLGISVQEASDILENEANIQAGRKTISLGSAGPGAPGAFRTREATPEEIETAKILQRVSDILEQSLETQKETNRKLEDGGLIGGPS